MQKRVCVALLLSGRDAFIYLLLHNFNEPKSTLHGKFKGFPKKGVNAASYFDLDCKFYIKVYLNVKIFVIQKQHRICWLKENNPCENIK